MDNYQSEHQVPANTQYHSLDRRYDPDQDVDIDTLIAEGFSPDDADIEGYCKKIKARSDDRADKDPIFKAVYGPQNQSTFPEGYDVPPPPVRDETDWLEDHELNDRQILIKKLEFSEKKADRILDMIDLLRGIEKLKKWKEDHGLRSNLPL